MSSSSSVKRGAVLALAITLAAALAACGNKEAPAKVALDDQDVLTTLNNYVQTSQLNCVAMPVAFNTPVEKKYADLKDPNGAQLVALVKLGLIAEQPADEGKIQFVPTDKGKEVYDGLQTNPPLPGFCSGTLAIDKVVSTEAKEAGDNYNRDKVVYTLKFDNPAAWASDADLRKQYPDFAKLVDGAGKDHHDAEIESRGQGWRVIEPNALAK
ncbi:hypothetical protein JCM19000A_40270 [Silvimonas sp. JCM 19000]